MKQPLPGVYVDESKTDAEVKRRQTAAKCNRKFVAALRAAHPERFRSTRVRSK